MKGPNLKELLSILTDNNDILLILFSLSSTYTETFVSFMENYEIEPIITKPDLI